LPAEEDEEVIEVNEAADVVDGEVDDPVEELEELLAAAQAELMLVGTVTCALFKR
jgi:hypothetical protein